MSLSALKKLTSSELREEIRKTRDALTASYNGRPLLTSRGIYRAERHLAQLQAELSRRAKLTEARNG